MRGPDGKPLILNTDQKEASPDGRWLYFQPLAGPMYRVETRWLDDPTIDPASLSRHVEFGSMLRRSVALRSMVKAISTSKT